MVVLVCHHHSFQIPLDVAMLPIHGALGHAAWCFAGQLTQRWRRRFGLRRSGFGHFFAPANDWAQHVLHMEIVHCPGTKSMSHAACPFAELGDRLGYHLR